MTTGLQFDAERHEYALDGRRVPSVTQVLADSGLVHYSCTSEFALWRGSACHTAIHLALTAGLDWSSVPEAFQPFVGAALDCVRDHRAEVVEVERRVYSRVYGYAGTLDLLVRIDGQLVEWDWKSGAPRPWTGLQLAAYAAAYHEETRERVHARYAVHLKSTGDYTVKQFTDRTDRDRFLAALTVARLRREWGLIPNEQEIAE